MGQPCIQEVNYHRFADQLKRAADSGKRIEKKEKEKWQAYIRAKQVLEPSCMSYAKSYGENIKSVIICDGGEWDGFYVYSPDDLFCFKFVRDPEPGAASPAAAEETTPPASEESPPGEAPPAESPPPDDPAPAADAPPPPVEPAPPEEPPAG